MATGTTIRNTTPTAPPYAGPGATPATPNGQTRRPGPGGTAPGSTGGFSATGPPAVGGGTPLQPAGTTAPAPYTGADANGNPITSQDATALITQELTSWGFGSDAVSWVTGEIQSNKGVDQILSDLRAQPFYVNSIFGQTNAARQKNGLGDMTEAQILAYQDYTTGDLSQAGIPKGFLTQDELVNLMGNDVSTAELDARVTKGFVDATNADADTRNALAAQGVDLGHLAAYYLDPTKALPFLQQQFLAAQVGGAATRTGYGAIDPATMMQLASEGVTASQAQTGFTDLGKQKNLFNPLPGSAQPDISQQVQLAAEFGGNAEDQALIKQVGDQRTAAFAGNYKYAEAAGRGITGLGPAPQNG